MSLHNQCNVNSIEKSLNEVVITSLGHQGASSAELGYSDNKCKSPGTDGQQNTNPVDALRKMLGGEHFNTGHGSRQVPSKMRIRGQSSLGGGSTPLIVINGVPVDRGNLNSSTVGVTGGGVYADGGDSFSSINPDDIESMTVLKGEAGCCFIGWPRAKDGVIMITTKNRKEEEEEPEYHII